MALEQSFRSQVGLIVLHVRSEFARASPDDPESAGKTARALGQAFELLNWPSSSSTLNSTFTSQQGQVWSRPFSSREGRVYCHCKFHGTYSSNARYFSFLGDGVCLASSLYCWRKSCLWPPFCTEFWVFVAIYLDYSVFIFTYLPTAFFTKYYTGKYHSSISDTILVCMIIEYDTNY